MKRSKTFSVFSKSGIASFFLFLSRFIKMISKSFAVFNGFLHIPRTTGKLRCPAVQSREQPLRSKATVVIWVLLHFNLVPPAPFLPQKPKASVIIRCFIFLRTRPKVFQFGLPNEEHSVSGHLPRCLV